jgi:hypothetical protein
MADIEEYIYVRTRRARHLLGKRLTSDRLPPIREHG